MDRRGFIRACGLGSAALYARGLSADELTLDKDVFLERVDRVIAQGPFTDTWESLLGYTAPQWYQDAKFGIFIHWGVYSVPARWSEWYPREMYRPWSPVRIYHRMKYGPQDKFGYKDFIPMFTAANYDPAMWADLFVRTGARYVVPVAEHHDGFPLYDCSFTDWNAVRMGPKRDLIGDLGRAVRARGLYFGVSSHRAAHWWFLDGGRKIKSDVSDPRYESFYGPAQPQGSMPDEAFMRDWLARSAEMVELFQPSIFYFDFGFGVEPFEPYRRKLAAYYYNRAAQWGEEVVLNYKNDAFPQGAAVLDLERSGLSEIRPMVWQTDTSVSFISWGYIDLKTDSFKSSGRLVSDLVDTVSKNGVLLLNVGPRPDGTIPQKVQDILLDIGRWLEVNGEAVYGSRPWKVYGEGPNRGRSNALFGLGEMFAPRLGSRDVRFTVKGDSLYAFVMDWPLLRRVSIKSLGTDSELAAGEISSVRLLGYAGPGLEWKHSRKSLDVTLPDKRPCDHAVVLEIKGLDLESRA